MMERVRLLLGAVAVVWGAAGVTAGCGGFSSSSPAPEAGDAGVPDTSVASPGDAATTPSDGGVDAALVCPPGAILCDDFERTELLGTWGAFAGDNDASVDASKLRIDSEFFVSPTRSLRADPLGISGATLSKPLASPQRVDVSFWLRTEASSPNTIIIASIEFASNVGYAHVVLHNGGLELVEQLKSTDGGVDYYSALNEASAPEGRFEPFTFTVDRTAGTFALTHGGITSTRPLTQAHAPTSKLAIGTVFTTENANPYWIDDVVVTTTP
jgi:hypothetical protein